MRKTGIVIGVLTFALGIVVPPAESLTVVMCGSTVKESITLQHHLLNCTGHGIVVGADNITIDLGGFILGGDGKSGGHGVYNDKAFENVRIRHGAITDFDDGVRIEGASATTNTIEALNVNGNRLAGIRLHDADDNTVRGNVLSGNNPGILLESSDANSVIGNAIDDDLPGISIGGDRNHVIDNELKHAKTASTASMIRFSGDGNLIEKNDISGGSRGVDGAGDKNVVEENDLFDGGRTGIVVLGSGNEIDTNEVIDYSGRGIWLPGTRSPSGNVVMRNEVEDNFDDGILVESDETQILDNEADNNGEDGIDSNGSHNLLVDNEADENGFVSGGGLGIDADHEGVQGSDNDADDNADSDECDPEALCD